MAETQPATPPAANGGIDMSALAALIGVAVVDAMKPLNERFEKLEGGRTPEATPHKEALTSEQVKQIISSELKTSQQAASQRAHLDAERQRFIDSKMKDVPAVYRPLLGDDPSQWTAKEQEIRKQVREDFKISGGTETNPVSGDIPKPGSSPSAPVDLSKLNGQQAILAGLSQSKPARSAPVTTVAGTPAAGTASTTAADTAK